MDEERVLHRAPDGRALLSYVRGGERQAFDVEVFDDDAIDAVLGTMSGWTVSGAPGLGGALVARGAAARRSFTVMHADLADPPVRAGLGGCRAVPCDRPPRELFPSWRAAYAVGDHPDRFGGDDAVALTERLTPVLDGTQGELLPWSRLAVDDGNRVRAGVVAVDIPRLGPWIGEVWRDPAPAFAGLGTALLRHALALAAASGVTGVGLSVSSGNPARRVYERLGFTPVRDLITVVVP